jgi:hypothetical protein
MRAERVTAMDATFTSPYMYWVGMDTDGASESQDEEFNRFYNDIHAHEVAAMNPGFLRVHRYELAKPDPRGDFGPHWLAVYEMADEQAASTYMDRNDGPPEGRPTYTPVPAAWRETAKTRWRIIWRQIADAGALDEPPYSIFIVGINPPAGASDEETAEFNEFYTNTHMGEVMAASKYGRANRWEQARAFLHPDPGCPRYLAIYEADDATGKQLETTPTGPRELSVGPVVWQEHTTPWRLVYNRVYSYTPGEQ